MSGFSAAYSSPISERNEDDFLAQAVDQLGPNCKIKRQSMHWQFPLAVNRHNADQKTAYPVSVMQEASETLSNPNSIITRTQQPILENGNKVPGNTLIGIYGVTCAVQTLGAVPVDAAALALLNGAIADYERSVLTFNTGGSNLFELNGDELWNYGVGFRGTALGASGANGYLVAPDKKRLGARITPIMLGNQEQMTLQWFYDRITDWPAIWTPRFTFICMVATNN